MMRMILASCLVLFIAFSFGCSKKKEAPPQRAAKVESTTPRDLAGKKSLTYDPVSGEELEKLRFECSYELDDYIYFFSSEENMEAFKADPQKYLDKIKEANQ